MTTSHLDLIAGHLNAPYGPVIQPADVARILRDASFGALRQRPLALAVASALFVECAPELIGSACDETGVDIVNAQRLYEELRSEGHPAIPRWDDAVDGVLT